MDAKQTKLQTSQPTLCKNCQKFYGCDAFQGHCSGCYKSLQKNIPQKQQSSPQLTKKSTAQTQIKTPQKIKAEQPEHKKEQKPAQINKKRCFNCNKKTGLLGIECKCGYVFCNSHRLPEDHACDFDHQLAGKKKLQKQIIKIYNGKVQEI